MAVGTEPAKSKGCCKPLVKDMDNRHMLFCSKKQGKLCSEAMYLDITLSKNSYVRPAKYTLRVSTSRDQVTPY